MSCCGKRRAAARRPVAVERPHRVSTAPDDTTELATGVAVEYRGAAPALFRVADGGRLYAFSPGQRVRRLPDADARLLLRNPHFQLEAQ